MYTVREALKQFPGEFNSGTDTGLAMIHGQPIHYVLTHKYFEAKQGESFITATLYPLTIAAGGPLTAEMWILFDVAQHALQRLSQENPDVAITVTYGDTTYQITYRPLFADWAVIVYDTQSVLQAKNGTAKVLAKHYGKMLSQIITDSALFAICEQELKSKTASLVRDIPVALASDGWHPTSWFASLVER